MKQNRLERSFLIALLFISLFSIVLNIFLFSQLRKYYTLLYALELDPLGLSYFQDIDQPEPAGNLETVVFFGDSRAAQWPSPTVDGFWFINRGIGNQTTAQIVNRFDEQVESLHPDIILLEMGINDLKTIPLFPERKEEIITNCQQNILKVVQKSSSMDSRVIVSTIFPTGKVPLERRLVWSGDIDRAVNKVNDYIRSLASDNVIIFDAAALLSNADGKMKQEYSFDELHLDQAGYDALNVELVKLLRSIK